MNERSTHYEDEEIFVLTGDEFNLTGDEFKEAKEMYYPPACHRISKLSFKKVTFPSREEDAKNMKTPGFLRSDMNSVG